MVARRFLLAALLLAYAPQAGASGIEFAAASELTGAAFIDRPIKLPVVTEFQTALQITASDLGMRCGQMEAYGWRLNSRTEQRRADSAFRQTAEGLTAAGYDLRSRSAPVVAKDVTLYTAKRGTDDFIFLWSAGDLGLVVALCKIEGTHE
jgi:hypothetical protein